MGNDPLFDLRSELYRIAGVDLTDIPRVSAIAAQVVLTEVGPDVSRFRNASAFASWLGLCPDKRIGGGKVLSTKTRKVKNRVAIGLRLGAKSLSRAKDYFGAFFRRMRARLGTAPAITATAHKLARVVYHVLHSKEPYTETIFHRCDEQEQQRAEMRLRKHAAQLGFQLLPSQQIQQLRKLVPEESCRLNWSMQHHLIGMIFLKVVFMAQGKRNRLSAEQRADMWCRWKAGESLHEIGRAFGKDHGSIRFLLTQRGGIVPAVRRRSPRTLTPVEREECRLLYITPSLVLL